MAKTGVLGKSDSALGTKFVLGAGAVTTKSLAVFAQNSLFSTLSQSAVSSKKGVKASNALTLSQKADPGKSIKATHAIVLTQTAVSSVKQLIASNSFELSHVATDGKKKSESVTHTLNVQHSVAFSGTLRKTATNVLALLHFGDNKAKGRDATNTLNVTQSLSFEKVKPVQNTLTLSHSATHKLKPVAATNALTLSQVARQLAKNARATNTLTVEQTARVNRPRVVATHSLSLDQLAKVPLIHRRSASNILDGIIQEIDASNPNNIIVTDKAVTLSQKADIVKTQSLITKHFVSLTQLADGARVKASGQAKSASNTVTLTHVAQRTRTVIATNALSLSHSATGVAAKVAQNTLVLGQVSVGNNQAGRSVVNVLSLVQAVSQVRIRDDSDKQFLIGVPPVLVPKDDVVFTHPFVSPTLTLTLRAPNLDNLERQAFQRISRESRGGSLIVFADPAWPKHKRFVVEFTALKETEGQSLLSFIETSLGQEIGYRDHENRSWKAVIVNPGEPLVRNRDDVLTMQLELEAELV